MTSALLHETVPPAAAEAPVELAIAPLVGREEVGHQTWLLHFELPQLARSIQPGRFLMVGVHPPSARAFLKRPFSVCDAVENQISLLLRVYGEGTAEMARRRVGDEFELLGPFGKGFRLASPAARVVMVAGGIGLAPFYILARRLKQLPLPPETVLVYGERTATSLTRGVEEFVHFDRVVTYTDDGSAGRRGNVVEGFRHLAQQDGLAGARLCACGPGPMLEALELERRRLGMPGEYSLEERMGCGFGICQGCAVRAAPASGERAYHLLCKAGPVMDPDLLLWRHQAVR